MIGSAIKKDQDGQGTGGGSRGARQIEELAKTTKITARLPCRLGCLDIRP